MKQILTLTTALALLAGAALAQENTPPQPPMGLPKLCKFKLKVGREFTAPCEFDGMVKIGEVSPDEMQKMMTPPMPPKPMGSMPQPGAMPAAPAQ